MSAPTIADPAYSPPRSRFDSFVSTCSDQKKWLYLVPTIGALALGAMFLPNIGVGIATGLGILAVNAVGLVAMNALGILPSDPDDNEYTNYLKKHPLLVSLVGPIAEEGVFRGIMQPLLTRSIIWLVPTAAMAFFGTGFTTAAVISLVATAAVFGALHYRNPHKYSHFQALFSTGGGIAFGLLSLQFGLGAAMAAHIINNTIISLILVGVKKTTSNASTLENRSVTTQHA